MAGKLALSFALAALIVAIGGFFAVLGRLDDLRERVDARDRGGAARTDTVRRDDDLPFEEASEEEPGPGDDPARQIAWLVEAVQRVQDDAYDYYSDTSSDLHALKREVGKIEGMLRKVVQGITGPGTAFPGVGWGLAARGEPLDDQVRQAYRAEAERHGVMVEEGRVTVRGFLNLSPDATMPIEYYMTRYPVLGHETLVHVVGKRSFEEIQEDPWGALQGLPTAIYKGMIVAGFREGEAAHPDPESDPRNPTWVLATGDVVHVYARWDEEDGPRLAPASDWVIEDPESGATIPPGSFRFTGSQRAEDRETGEEVLTAELSGVVVSVWPSRSALVEVALESALTNSYAYNFSKIPKHRAEGPRYLDIVFSKTPLALGPDGSVIAAEGASGAAAPSEGEPRRPGEDEDDGAAERPAPPPEDRDEAEEAPR
jgi:hypothetical protein